ncbi:DNA topoisomerase IB [Phytoactinopolyspora alkaliphila]|uniref:DNA topoisomerase IB n=1 Tax=Phytoactinopolyspora alkaliphila TaxID=1783498 RepID=A0A6N9YNN1_9ACTN|nr:DNA topoisomerase IB [Phytoactinopolyspora alkaliphila]NED96557.1 DNA topoisomerase IB [Phytoactinopolyspora alkaliphila]
MRLRRWSPAGPALSRRRRGRGFSYHDVDGSVLDDDDTLRRIKELVIPPAWKNVRICPWPNGHLQAVGVDDAGRRQYIYHPQWRKRRDAEKFERIRQFGRRLPDARRQIEADLETRGLNRRRVLAAAARLLDIGFFRVGGKEYAEENGSYGLATVLCEHVHVRRGGTVVFDYPAKWGQERVQSIADPDVVAVVRALKKRRRPDQAMLAYYEGRAWHEVSSTDVNEYLRELFEIEVSSKDFRTWHGTVLAAVALALAENGAGHSTSATARRRACAQAMREVSHYLGNTPAICRTSYVDPTVVDAFEEGTTISATIEELGSSDLDEAADRARLEKAVLELLEDS